MTTANSKRIAKNTFFMYVRMVLNVILALYTSKLLLKYLGVSDFGIYNLVGSVIAAVSMLQTFFSYATQRFFNFEMGKGNHEKMKIIFNMSLYVNILISFIFVIMIEIFGYWFLTYYVNVPADRILAAQWVLQLSIISAVILILTTPYDAIIIAYEKLNFYAFVSVLKTLLCLLVIFLTPYLGDDKLIAYAFLILVVQLLIRIINSIYCSNNFNECKYIFCWDKTVFKEMLSFAGWQLLGTSSYNITQNGINVLFNIFAGTTANAARGIAYQVNAAVFQLTNNVNVAITPFCIRSYAEGNMQKVFNMFYFSSKIFLLITFCISIPFLLLTNEVLNWWLNIVPEFTVGLVQLVLVCSIIRSLHNPIDVIFKAKGSIKYYQIAEGIILFIPLPLSYYLLKSGYSVYSTFVAVILFEVINLVVDLILLSRIVNISLDYYFKNVITILLVFITIGVLAYYFSSIISIHYFFKCILSLVIIIIAILFVYFFFFNQGEKKIINIFLFNK